VRTLHQPQDRKQPLICGNADQGLFCRIRTPAMPDGPFERFGLTSSCLNPSARRWVQAGVLIAHRLQLRA
ncbi:hypothetical protein ACIRST_42290, partial [Kitasatospora sp. NPDC101447]|uniref:hypothetical protein n=1 Tax=Kitasatospora sp. NPDC101447 TaxID=3364102 RepID=UPI003804641B